MVNREEITLRTYVVIDNMQPQYAAITGSLVRGDVCLAGMAQLYVEVAPGSGIYRMLDVALKQGGAKPGFQIVEREYGALELHSFAIEEVKLAGAAMLQAAGLTTAERMPPKVVSEQVITRVDPYQAQLINRDGRYGSVLVPGEALLIMEVEPAAYISLAVNEAEKSAAIKIVTFDVVGRYGRLYVAGELSQVESARQAALAAMEALSTS
ncbi:MAG: hypothetical protein FWF06_01775 [Symbiobacteriaceae bacterium]|nr:hypothetical protein [Symbiobacteriaceae bacterium]